MANQSHIDPIIRPTGTWPIVAMASLLASWLLFYGSLLYGFHLQEEYGPIPDVWDALMCGEYVGRHTLPWRVAVVFLDILAIVLGGIPVRQGWPLFAAVIVVVSAVLSLCLHGLVLAMTGLLIL